MTFVFLEWCKAWNIFYFMFNIQFYSLLENNTDIHLHKVQTWNKLSIFQIITEVLV
jgi:hypothetical protein